MLFFFGKKLNYYAVDKESGKGGSFSFLIKRKHGEFSAYVLERHPLGVRSCNLTNVHLLRDDGKYYVCVVGMIRSYAKMVAVAKFWARRYIRYVATGKDYNIK